MIDGEPRTVVGVMPRGFWFPDPGVRIWHARALDPEGRNGSYTFVGRTAPGVDVRHMNDHVRRITALVGSRFQYIPGADKMRDAAITPLRDELLGSMRPAVIATFVAMALILLIACANVAALMLGQVEGRASELAVRSALGANRRRLTQQLVVEALLVGAAAGLVGAALAAAGFRVLARALPVGAWGEHATFDWTTFAVALGLAVAAVLLVVLVPSVSLWRGDLRGALSRARTGGVQGRGGRMERGLVVAEVALAMLIASGAALLVRSVANLYAIDPGIETQGVAVVDVVSRREMPVRERGRAVEEVAAALRTLPGVRSAAVAMKIPLRGGGDSFGIGVEGRPRAERTNTYFRMVTPEYFSTMGIRLREGRAFDVSDRPIDPDSADQMSVVVNAAFARKHFPGASAVGRRIAGGYGNPQLIVGVVADVAEAALTEGGQPTVYYLGSQAGWFGNRETFVLRTTRPADAAAVLEAARRTVQRVAPELAVQETTTMTRVFDAAVGPARQVMVLLSVLSALALLLGAVGIYGVIAHFAARRQRDWAIRVALGLVPSRVVGRIVGQGVALIGAGVAFGLAGTLATAHFLSTFLFGVGAVDLPAFAAASLALLAVGVAAAFVPAWRVGRSSPSVVLRES
jgi:predicted permease